jgi:hypothetical protein
MREVWKAPSVGTSARHLDTELKIVIESEVEVGSGEIRADDLGRRAIGAAGEEAPANRGGCNLTGGPAFQISIDVPLHRVSAGERNGGVHLNGQVDGTQHGGESQQDEKRLHWNGDC